MMAKKKRISKEIIDQLHSPDAIKEWCKAYKVNEPGDEPNTKAAFGIPFEKSGILPYGWPVNPYDKDAYFWDQLGLSCLFSDFFQNKARYCNTDKCWYIFDSEIGWQKDVGRKKLKKLVLEFKRKLLYAESLIDNGKAKESFHKNFYGMLLTDSQYHALADASSEDYSFSTSEMDTAIDILAVQNGVIKLNRDGTFDFHTFIPEDMTTMHMATVYDPKAKCPTWERFINEVLGGDQEIIRFFKIFIGQTLYGHNDQKAFGILYGPSTNNGKTTLVKTLKGLYGDYAVASDHEMLAQKKRKTVGDSQELARTKGTRLVTISEPNQDMIVDVALLKNLTGNSEISVRFLNQNSFSFIPGFTPLIDTNHKLWMRDRTIFDRGSVILFEFNQVFTGNNADSSMDEKLRQEYPGILNWMLEGWADYCAAAPNGRNWIIPKSMADTLNEYSHESDSMEQFISETYTVTGNRKDSLYPKEAYRMYCNWCHDNGKQHKSNTLFQNEFKKHLTDMLREKLNITGEYNENFSRTKDSQSNRYYWGITCK